MNRRKALNLMGGGLAAAAAPPFAATRVRKPNVIVVISDDAGHVDFGCYGTPDLRTPNIDRLARDGVRCTNGYVTASVCAPSRAGLITGRYQQRFGHEFNGPNSPVQGYRLEDMGLDPNEKTLGDMMKAQGYRTIAIGKWHLGTQEQFRPLNRGFDEFHGFFGGSRSYFPVKKANEAQAMRQGHAALSEEEHVKYLTDDLTTAAVDFIGRNAGQPFFMYLAYNAVHGPMHAKQEDIDRFKEIEEEKRRIYAAMMISLDEGIGRLAATLKKLGIEDSTLVFFINDNGGATGNASDNGPLRGMKGSKWEGGIRVPFIVKWPGKVPAGREYDQPVTSLDVFPTALAASQGTWQDGRPLDGINLLPYLQGKKTGPSHKVLFWRRGVAAAARQGRWKLIRVEGTPTLLFDLKKDLSETTDVSQKNPDIVKKLLNALSEWETGLAPPKWREGEKWENNQVRKHQMDIIGRKMERQFP